MKPARRILLLALLLAASTFTAAAVGIVVTHSSAVEQDRAVLGEIVRREASLLEAWVREERHSGPTTSPAARELFLQRVGQSLHASSRFGRTGELLLARRQEGRITFLNDRLAGVVPAEGRAEPMRRALGGKSGTLVGVDYRGVEVLAAYTWVPALKLGIVAKVDESEVRAPLLRAVAEAGALVLLLTGLGSYLFFRWTEPFIQELARSESRTRFLFEHGPDAVFLADAASGTVLEVNAAAVSLLCQEEEQIRGRVFTELFDQEGREEFRRGWERYLTQLASGRRAPALESEIECQGSKCRPVEVVAQAVELDGQKMVQAVVHDVSARKAAERERQQLEAELQQAQKMEVVGRLAGGVAHDFNNLLTGIRGYTDFVIERVLDQPEVLADAREVRRLADRAAGLTRQLLAFSRRQDLKPAVLSFHQLVTHLLKMVKRLIGEDVKIEFLPQARQDTIRGDAAQLEQVLVNLALNARDAMPQGGRLIIRTSNEEHSEDETRWLVVEVEDTGCGMPEEVRRRVFEPFFTTKDVSRGTGLGLSTAYGVLNSHGGSIAVSSTPGKGSTFLFKLPLSQEEMGRDEGQAEAPARASRGEKILVVEDEPAVLTFMERVLRNQGYQVVARDTPAAAKRELDRPFDLLIADLIMPGGTGRDLYQAAEARHPGLRVLFVSGYAERREELTGDHPFLGKPFSARELLAAVGEILSA